MQTLNIALKPVVSVLFLVSTALGVQAQLVSNIILKFLKFYAVEFFNCQKHFGDS